MIISILLPHWLLLSYAQEIFRQTPVREKKTHDSTVTLLEYF